MYNLSNFKSTTINYITENSGNINTTASFEVSGFNHTIEEDKYPGLTYYNEWMKDNLFISLSKKIQDNYNYNSQSLIPPGLIHIDKNFLVFERPPTHKLINIYNQYLHDIGDDTKLYSYYLPIPWQIYIVEFDPNNNRTCLVKMFFSQSSLHSFDQQIFLPPIPNFYVNGLLCRPFFNSMDDIERYSPDISGIIESAYDWVWSSNFNLDLSETISSVYLQKNPIQLSRGITDSSYTSYKLSMSVINNFYVHWESLSLSEVPSFVWPNPAFAQTFQEDLANVDAEDLFQEWCYDNDIVIDSDEEHDEYYQSDSFRSSIPNPRNVTKTFKDIMNYSTRNTSFPQSKKTLKNILVSYATESNLT